jgi:hypothetical protein
MVGNILLPICYKPQWFPRTRFGGRLNFRDHFPARGRGLPGLFDLSWKFQLGWIIRTYTGALPRFVVFGIFHFVIQWPGNLDQIER